MKEKLRKENAITLIALVITIVVLLILAGVSIIALTGDEGLLKQTSKAENKNKIEELKEKLELQKTEALVEHEGKITYNDYIEKLKENKIIEDANIELIEEEVSCYLTLEGYVFLIEDLRKGDVKIEYQGKTGDILPRFEIETIVTTNSIKLKILSISTDELIFNIKTTGTEEYTEDGTYTIENSSETIEYVFDELSQEIKYDVQVIGVNAIGENIKEIKEIQTGKVPDLTEADIEVKLDKEGWTNQNVVATVTSKIAGYDLQLSNSINGPWNTTNTITLSQNGTFYIRLWDGINDGGYASREISNIEKTVPTISSLQVTKATSTSITVQAKASDSESGIIGYQFSSNNNLTISSSGWTDISEVKSEITYSETVSLGQENYFYVKDKAGNISKRRVSYQEKLLYDRGTISTEIEDIAKVTYSSMYQQGNFTKQANQLYISKSIGGHWATLYIATTKAMNFSNYSKLCISFSSMELVSSKYYSGSNVARTSFNYGIASTKNATSDFIASETILSPTSANSVNRAAGIYEVDISEINSEGYIKFIINTSTYNGQKCVCTIDEIWVE